MTDPNTANLRNRFDFGAPASWSTSLSSAENKSTSTSAAAGGSLHSSPSRSLPGSYVLSPEDEDTGTMQRVGRPGGTMGDEGTGMLDARKRYATTVEDVPEEEQVQPEAPALDIATESAPAGNRPTQNVERTCRICLSGSEDGMSLFHIPFPPLDLQSESCPCAFLHLLFFPCCVGSSTCTPRACD